MQKYLLAVLLSVGFLGCNPEDTSSGPSSPDINISITNNQGSNQNQSGGSGEGGACAGITGTPEFIVDSGTFSGGKAKVGEPLLGHIAGLQVPSSCSPRVAVSPLSAACTAPISLPQTREAIHLSPIAPGRCQASVCIGDHFPCAAVDVEVIS